MKNLKILAKKNPLLKSKVQRKIINFREKINEIETRNQNKESTN